ncbi:MAG: L,D-transpeptidase family protein [Pseudomonadota bacterium]
MRDIGDPPSPDLPPIPTGVMADRILVDKSDRRMVLLRDGEVIAAYRIALGFGADDGPKRVQGDGRTPEGLYEIDWRNPDSRFHLSLHISYPSKADRARAHTMDQAPGGDIMIHGLPNGMEWVDAAHARQDWTEGCIAVTNAEMQEIWRHVPNGTPIEIRA